MRCGGCPLAATLPALGAYRSGVDCMRIVCFDGSLRFFVERSASGSTPCLNGYVAMRTRLSIRSTSDRVVLSIQ
jgi:hypothetical protein